MVELRPYRPDDLEALYRICLITGASGQDATPRHNDPRLLGHIYAAPYGVFEPEHTIVVEDEAGVAGYVVGTHDSVAYEERLERDWWPALRARYARAEGMTEADQRMIAMINRPPRSPEELTGPYPAHIHMNLLPRLRGQRIGSRLMERWADEARAAGVKGIHLAAGASNTGGVAFWSKHLTRLREDAGAVWFGLKL